MKTTNLRIHLVHYNTPELGEHWLELFKDEEGVTIMDADIFETEYDALASPGNSFGFMDGGLDLLISQKYGWGIQAELQQKIAALPMNELLVGQAIAIHEKGSGKYIICAPTMRTPGSDQIPQSVNAYLAMKAILLQCMGNPEIQIIAIPGLCTGTGRMSYDIAAFQMFMAYKEVIKGKLPHFHHFREATRYQLQLKKQF